MRHLAGKVVTLAMVSYLFSLAHERVMVEAIVVWQILLVAAVGR
jgi:hypothetical protein